MTIEIVIARYNEDLSWLRKIPKKIKITIYNKGLDDINIQSIKLPNIGRESHTYLYHIINNYDNLADKTIFCQGDSIFHSPGFIDLLKNHDLFEPVQPLSAYYWPEEIPPFLFSNPPKSILNKTKNLWIKDSPIHVEYADNNFVSRYPYIYFQEQFIILVELIKKTYNIDNVYKFFVERFRIKNVDLNELFPICYSGLFSVDKEVILENSIDFYNNIESILIYAYVLNSRYSNKQKPVDWGLFLEKLWLVIFNYKKHNKNYINLKINDYPFYKYNLTIKYKKPFDDNKNNASLGIVKIDTLAYGKKNINKENCKECKTLPPSNTYEQQFEELYFNKSTKDKDIRNIVIFKLINITCELYMDIKIDNIIYNINITRYIIFLKYPNKVKFYKDVKNDELFQNIFSNIDYITIRIELYNNNLNILLNDLNIMDYKFKYDVYKINDIKIFSVNNDSKIIDLLKPDFIKKEIGNYNETIKCLLVQ